MAQKQRLIQLNAVVLNYLFLSLLLTIPSMAEQKPVSKTVLDNGLTVLIQELSSSQEVSIYAAVKAGSSSEGDYLGMGISHFVEHMLFKGTPKRPAGTIAKEVKAMGGEINASTGLDYTLYTLDLPKQGFAQGVEILSDMIINSSFETAEVENERKVIHGEMDLYKDNPDRVISEMVFSHVYTQHPYRHPIIGYPALFDSITRDQLYNYYKSRYVPNNMVISIAGPVDSKEVLGRIQEAFKGFKPSAFLDMSLRQEPGQSIERRFQQYYPTKLIRFSIAFQGVSVSDPDLYALDVLSMALGQGKSSRLYQQAYLFKHWVEGISASNFTPYDKGVFEIEGSMSQDRLNELVELTRSIIKDIQDKGLNQQELERTKRQTLASFIFSNQTAPAMAQRAVIDEALTSDPNFSQHYVQAVKNVSNEDIKRVARKYLQESNRNINVLLPKQMQPPQQEKKPAKEKGDIKKVVLDNGITVLISKIQQGPVGSIQLFMHGGARLEDETLAGLATLTGSVWGKQSRQYSQQGLSTILDNRAIKFSYGMTNSTMRFSLDFISQDFNLALDILEDVLKNPSMPESIINQQKHQMLIALENRPDDMMAHSYRALMETLYLKHPVRKDELGNSKSLARIKRADIIRFAQSLVFGENMVISVCGDIDSSDVLNLLKKKFGSIPRLGFEKKVFVEPAPEQTRQKTLKMPKQEALWMMAFQAPVLKDKDRYGMELINVILGSGLSGRLFTRIRDELAAAYSTSSWYSPDMDSGTFILYVLTKPDKIDSVKRVVLKELEEIRTKEISSSQLQAAKNYFKGGFQRSLLTVGALAYTTARDELDGLGYEFYRHYDQWIDQVSSADVQRIAHQYLDVNKAAIVVTNPESFDKNIHE